MERRTALSAYTTKLSTTLCSWLEKEPATGEETMSEPLFSRFFSKQEQLAGNRRTHIFCDAWPCTPTVRRILMFSYLTRSIYSTPTLAGSSL